MNNEDAVKVIRKLSEAEREYSNTEDPRDRQFRAAMDIAFEGLDAKLAPLLSRLDTLEESARNTQPSRGMTRRHLTLAKTRSMTPEEIKALNITPEELGYLTIEKTHETEELINADLDKIVARLGELEKGMALIREKGIFYKGVYQYGETYDRGDLVTHAGSMWVAGSKTSSGPPGNHWQMCVKSGGGKP